MRSNWASGVEAGVRISGDNLASEDAGMKLGGTDAIGKLGGVLGVPEAQIVALSGGDAAAIGQAKRTGGMGGGALQSLKRGHAEQGAGHVHRQGQRGDRRGTGVAIGGQRHRNTCRTQGRDGGHLRFAQGVEGPRQDNGDGARCSHGFNPVLREVFKVVGGQRVETGGQGGAFQVGKLLGVEFDGQAKGLGRQEQPFHLGGGKRDAFAKGVYRIDQAFGMGRVQRGDCHLVDIGIGAAVILRRGGGGGKGERSFWGGGGGGGGGGRGAAAGAGHLFITGTVQAHFELGGAVA